MATFLVGVFQGMGLNDQVDKLERIRKEYDRTENTFKLNNEYTLIREDKFLSIVYYVERNGKRILKTSVNGNFVSRSAGGAVKGLLKGVTFGMADSVVQFLVKDPRVKCQKTIDDVYDVLKPYVKEYKEKCESSPLSY